MTKISWTNKTWNIVTGCAKISEGCRNCYAEKMALRLKAMGQEKYKNGFKPTIHPECLNQIKKWKNKMVFVCSMGDLFHRNIPFGFLLQVFMAMLDNPSNIYQLLTKRPDNALLFINTLQFELPDNIWIGVTAENQISADFRVPILKEIPAKVKFISIEPMLEEIMLIKCGAISKPDDTIDWIIIGCESGPNRRKAKEEWYWGIKEKSLLFDVPLFIKQIEVDGKVEKDINNFPEGLRIQEYPKILEKWKK